MEHLRKIDINTGAAVSGKDFFNREKEFESFKRRLNSTKHIVISQIRRTGKTSFMKEFIKRNQGSPILYLAVQGCQTEENFYKRIYAQTIEYCKNEKALDFMKNKWNKITEIIPEIKGVKLGQIKETNDQIVDKLIKIFKKEQFILFIDEFPDFIINLKKNGTVESFLGRFRDFRNECDKLKTVLTGSINLIRTVSKLGLSDKLNEYKTFKFSLFSKSSSLLLFRCLLFSIDYELNKKEQNYILPYIEDGMPYFIQLLADNIMDISPENKVITINNLKVAIKRFRQLDEFGLEQFHDRLNKYLKEEKLEKPAKIILSHLSHDKLDFDDLYSFVDNEINREQLDELLNRLEEEAYIKKEGEDYAFLSKLMAGWWREKKHFERR
ncbi:MAG: ATP-binding protein [Armatimonadetes bacterium]|nr:ATP-binding protein [Armatimonadota bacterium]